MRPCGLVFALAISGILIHSSSGQTPTAQYTADLNTWNTAVSGTNLAAGLPVTFSIAPNYSLTNSGTYGANNALDLTNGSVATRNYTGALRYDGKIWNCADAVGWNYLTQPVTLTVDLGAQKDIARFAIRFLGGKSQSGLTTPKKFVVLASNDNVTFYPIAQREKLDAASSALADDVTHYYVAETGTDFVKTFTFDFQIKARYIALQVTTDGGAAFTDELAVIQGAAGSGLTNWNTEYWRSNVEWDSAAFGTNLASGLPTNFSSAPDYSLTNTELPGASNPSDLTNGLPATLNYTGGTRYDGRIWNCADAVGWRYLTNNVTMYLNLGDQKAIRRVALRVLGGAEQPGFTFPSKFEVVASKDGTHYYNITSMSKLQSAEANQADGVNTYYLAESGTSYIHTFYFDLNIQAQYIGIRVSPESSWLITDELAILAAPSGTTVSTGWDTAANATLLVTSGVGALPRKDGLYLSTNVLTPNWLTATEARPSTDRTEKASIVFELPDGISITAVPGFAYSGTSIPGASPAANRWTLVPSGTDLVPTQGLYFTVASGTNIEGTTGKIYTTRASQGNVPENQWTFPIHALNIPTVPAITAIDVGNGWVIDGNAQNWPNYLTTVRSMGFNQISTFPRYYSGTNTLLYNNAVSQGFKIAYMESPFHVLQNTAKQSGWTECFNTVSGTTGNYLSPIYTGAHYVDEISRVQTCALQVNPDFVYFDIELWDQAVNESRKDPAMQNAITLSGKSESDFLCDQGYRMMTDLYTAINAARPAVIGVYNNSPQIPIFHQVYKWSQIYPSKVALAMPSLYVHGDASKVHDVIKSCRTSMGNRQIIPWLTGGAYGEFDSKWIEPMILETILNGARGFIYYAFADLDPQDYYFHAKALFELAPYQTLLSSGAPVTLTSSNTSLTSTCFKSSSLNQALVLIGNYKSSTDATTTITSPVSFSPGTVQDVVTSTYLTPSSQITVTVPGNGFVLLYYATAGHP